MKKPVDTFLNDCRDDSPMIPAPAALRSRLYTALIREIETAAPLRPLAESAQAGYAICDWENLTRHLPRGESRNHCIICHARVLAETFDSIAMPWAGCPYHKLHSS